MRTPSREQLLHMLYEAAELEHDLMCTYLYAAFSLKTEADGLRAEEAAAVARWRHHEIEFTATGEPPTASAEMLAVRDGELEISPVVDGPLRVRGNLEITSGTGRVVARVEQAKLCRCGGSNTKPFCDGTHQRIGFRAS